jgi:S1-C subfamily serine protease
MRFWTALELRGTTVRVLSQLGYLFAKVLEMKRCVILQRAFVALSLVLLLQPHLTHAQSTSFGQQPATLSSEELFRRYSPSIFVVETLDEDGSAVALGSGVVVKSTSDVRRASPHTSREFLESKEASFIVTNAHVVSQGFSVRVRQGNKSWQAETEQIDPYVDLCLLKVEDLVAAAVSPRMSDTLTVGERVYAIGAPEGLELSLSDGLVSGFRQVDGRKVIQTTAPISHGSSGGGLFDSKGMLIGITSFFLGDSQNLNFAIPVENIEALLSQKQSETSEGWIWIGDQAMNEQAPGPTVGMPPMGIGPEQEEWLERAKRQLEVLRTYWRRGVHAYRIALRLDPNNYQVWEKLGDGYARLNEPGNMSESFNKAIHLKPDDVTIWERFSEAYERIGDQEGAIEACHEALKQGPHDPLLWANLADAYGKSQPKAALSALSEAEHFGLVDGFAWWRIGSRYQLLHHYKEAESAFLQSIRLEPNNSLYLFDLGALYALEHKRSKVREVYERLVTANPAAAEKLKGLSSMD